MSNAREIVVKMLTKTEKNNSYSNILLSDTLKKYDLSTQDKKFASALFYGVLERKLTLDGIITDNSAKSSKKLSDDVRNIIRTGLYQILYMDSVPDNAAVDESVKLAKKNKNPAVSGFVNALLREFLRKGKKLPGGKDRIDKLCIEYSCPKWLIRKWMSEYGEDVGYSVSSFDKITVDGHPGYKIEATFQAADQERVYQTVYILLSKYRTFTITFQRAEDDDCLDAFSECESTIHVQ